MRSNAAIQPPFFRRAVGATAALLLAGLAAGAAFAANPGGGGGGDPPGPTPGQNGTPGEFVSACAGIGTGALVTGGESIQTIMFDGSYNPTCLAATGVSGAGGGLSVGVKTPAGATFNGGPGYVNGYSGSAKATISGGSLTLFATATGPKAVQYPSAVAQGGFTQQYTFNNLPPGVTQGYYPLTVEVDATLTAVGDGARPGIVVTPYVDGHWIETNALFKAQNPTPIIGSGIVSDAETRAWFNPSPSAAPLVINQMVTFEIPFTVGVPLDLGLYAYAMATTTGFGGDNSVDTMTADPPTFALTGNDYVYVWNGSAYTPNTDFSIQTSGGVDLRGLRGAGAGHDDACSASVSAGWRCNAAEPGPRA